MQNYQVGKKYYWIILTASFLVFSLSVSLGYNCWSLFTIPICEEISITRQQFGGIFTSMLIAQTVGALITDRLIQKLGMMRFMRIGITATTAMLFLFSRVNNLTSFYVISFLTGLPLAATCFIPFSVIMANWFEKKRGFATGIVFMGSGLSSMLFTPLVNRWIISIGWRSTIALMAGIVGVVTIPLCFFVIKATPQEVGLLPYGARENAKIAEEVHSEGECLAELVKHPVLWLFVIYTICAFLETMHSNTIVPYLNDVGLDSGYAAGVWALCMGMLAVCRAGVGYFCDWLGTFRAVRILSFIAPLMVVGLLGAGHFPGAAALIILGEGIGEAISTVCYPMMVRGLFGQKHYTKIYGVLTAISNAVGALTPILYGEIYERTGSYVLSYKLFGALYFVGVVCLLLSFRMKENNG